MDEALARIEAAIGRLERAASLRAQSDAGLLDRHERLKASVSQALAKLDDLIAAQRR